jgi:(p)ppGpp synthase/HD superfamily hydrolase
MGYSERFDSALVYAHDLHRDHIRKGSGVPYVTHLLGVASIVGENGGTEDQVIAALLHDAIEDCIGRVPDIREQIQERFGQEVLAIVEACTDSDQVVKAAWRPRKVAYLERLKLKPKDSPALLVSKADKLHNLRSIARDYSAVGDELWGRFKGKRDGTLWYYNELVAIFEDLAPGPIQKELRALMDTLNARVLSE